MSDDQGGFLVPEHMREALIEEIRKCDAVRERDRARRHKLGMDRRERCTYRDALFDATLRIFVEMREGRPPPSTELERYYQRRAMMARVDIRLPRLIFT